eukprot:3792289-Pleurochrysis_carterae.AAC.1
MDRNAYNGQKRLHICPNSPCFPSAPFPVIFPTFSTAHPNLERAVSTTPLPVPVPHTKRPRQLRLYVPVTSSDRPVPPPPSPCPIA